MLSVGDSVFLTTQWIFFMEWDEKVSKAVEGEKEGNLRNLLIHQKLEKRVK